jgi:hypothetical protein
MKTWKKLLIALAVLAIVLAAIVCSGSERIMNGPLAINSAFSGLLALTGFMFTARTFITFKLNEVVYGSDNYRGYVEELKKAGAYSDPLYQPLKELDSTLGRTSLFCFGTLIFLVGFALLPKEWGSGRSVIERIEPWSAGEISVKMSIRFLVYQMLTWLVYSAILLSIIRVFWCILRVNINIKRIITQWEDSYSRKAPPAE